jgi:hypothetical protein
VTKEQLAYEHAKSVGWNEAIQEAAMVVERWSLPTIQAPSMWLIDKAGIASEIRALDRSIQAVDD